MNDTNFFYEEGCANLSGIFLFTLAPIKSRLLRDVTRIIAEETGISAEEIVHGFQLTHGLLANGLTRDQANAIVPALGLAGVSVSVNDAKRVPRLPPPRPVAWIERADEGCSLRSDLGLHRIRWDSVLFGVFASLPSGNLVDIVTQGYERFRLGFAPPPEAADRGEDVAPPLTTPRACGLLLTYNPELLRNDGLSSCSIGQEATEPRFGREAHLERYEQLFVAEILARR